VKFWMTGNYKSEGGWRGENKKKAAVA